MVGDMIGGNHRRDSDAGPDGPAAFKRRSLPVPTDIGRRPCHSLTTSISGEDGRYQAASLSPRPSFPAPEGEDLNQPGLIR